MSRREELSAALAAVERRLAAACAAAGRPRDAVRLVAVTKTRPVEDCRLLHELGVADLGEARAGELAEKAALLPAPVWHVVGQVQTNKASLVAAHADVVHSVDRRRLVRALGEGARRAGREVACLVQVSLDGDPTRGGALPGDVAAVADAIAAEDGLVLRGVMAVAPLGVEPAAAFARLADVARRLREDHPGAQEVSAGMSGDLEEAVAAGATAVRVGTALVGSRPPLLR